MLTLCDLDILQKDKNNHKKTEPVDITDIEINSSQTIAKRMENYFLHIKNPYFFMCGEVPVILSFSDNKAGISEKLQEHFIRQKKSMIFNTILTFCRFL